MAFQLYMHDGFTGSSLNNDYLMTNSEAVADGEVLVWSSGRLTKCGATTVPEVISNCTIAAATTSVTPVQCTKVNEEQVWKTTSTATVATTLIGSKVTLYTDGLQVTSTTGSGVFEILSTDGATTTSTVTGRFKLS